MLPAYAMRQKEISTGRASFLGRIRVFVSKGVSSPPAKGRDHSPDRLSGTARARAGAAGDRLAGRAARQRPERPHRVVSSFAGPFRRAPGPATGEAPGRAPFLGTGVVC